MSEIIITPEHQQAISLISARNPAVLISGKAGVGKTTFLNVLFTHFTKMGYDCAIVAPTGIAALQAEGATINSFFKLPPNIIHPEMVKFDKYRLEVFEKLKILFIDEISMARCDVIDAIDITLRKHRKIQKPFGGVQVVMLGDLYQLPPPVNDEDKKKLVDMGYDMSGFFFDAKVFRTVEMHTIELNRVFRQDNVEFVNLLNKIRVAEDVLPTINEINKRCFKLTRTPHKNEVTLTTTNALADSKNVNELNALPGEAKTYSANRTEGFKMTGSNLPSPELLTLKVGALVMFTANDPDQQWVNGLTGIVKELNNNTVVVERDSGELVVVPRHDWLSYDWRRNEKTNKLERVETGKYTQFPLTLGWAVTIHKSQGKTIKHLMVDLGSGAFAAGQTYVALSRAVDINNLAIKRPLRSTDVIASEDVKAFFKRNSSQLALM